MARSRELDRLRALFDSADAGSAAAVLVAGDAGVGKTRLTEELTSMATDKGAVVLTGRCLDAGETGLPYLPFAEALAQVADQDRAVSSHPALARLLPGAALPLAADQEQDVGQLQLFDAVHGLLGELAGPTCVVLVLEDLHWADGSTRRLLSFLLSRLRAQRLLIVGTYRSDDLHRRHPLRPLVAELVRLPAVERLELAPLGAAEARALVAALADDRLPDDVLREVAGRSEGNAFFAEELLAAYVESGGGGIPATLVDVLLARVEGLSEAAQLVVRVASVAGRRVPHARLRGVAALGDVELEQALREAVQHHILVPGDGEVYAFRHALVREAVYGDLLPGERVRLHAAYGERLAGEQGSRGAAAELAHHSMESHALPQALAASINAADEAAELGAPAEALQQLERALKLWHAVPEPARPAEVTELALLLHASWVASKSGEPERSVAFARSAVERADDGDDDPEVAADARRRLAKGLEVSDGKEAEATEIIGQAWAMISDRPATEVKAWVLAVYAGIERRADRFDEAREWAELAVRTAREAGARGAEADALATLASLDTHVGRVAESEPRLRAAIGLAAEVNALTTELRARFYLCANPYELGRFDEAAPMIDEAVGRALSTGLTWSGYGMELRVLQLYTRYAVGDWDGAEAAAEPPGHRVSSSVSALLAAIGALVMVGRGRFAEAGRLVRELRSAWGQEHRIAPTMGGVTAELSLWQGRPEQAITAVRDALGWEEPPWHLSSIRLAALGVSACADLARRASSRRDVEGGQVAVDEGVVLAEQARTVAELGIPRTGSLGPEGRAWLARAEAEASRLRGVSDPVLWQAVVDGFGYGAVYEQALCRWRLGEALLAADRRDAAAEELRLAEGVAQRLGARPLRDAVRKLARRGRIALGDDVSQRVGVSVVRDAVDPFTPRERAVLGLVALGRTNRQVGAELFISEKTVSVHMTRVMAKLGAGNRAEAVAIAYDRGLLDLPSRENA